MDDDGVGDDGAGCANPDVPMPPARIRAAIPRTRQVQRRRPRSLNPPKSGLLITEAIKMPLRAIPVSLRVNPCACCRKREPSVPMLLPVKSRRLNAKQAAMKKSQSAGVGKRLGAGDCDGPGRT